MTAEEALRRLSQAAAGETRKLRELAQDISADSRRPADELTLLWLSAEGRNLQKTETLLEQLGELCVPSLLALRKPPGAGRAVLQAARVLSTAENRVADRLLSMLDSSTPMPPGPSAGQAEVKELQSRECDEAYLLARQLLKGDDSDRERFQLRRAFLLMPEADRDAEIGRYKSSGQWSDIVEKDD